jgi:eukaryotic-like serine/threonine-protein kinase
MNDPFDRDVAVFIEALEMPAAERAAFLERACGGDNELRRRVQDLLDGHEQVGDFLEHSPHETTTPGRSMAAAGEQPGDRVGRYKLLQQIGEGGCGVVFMAEQHEPVRRRVALKIIKPGMDTKSVIARFEAEGQALALMDHPSIAKIFDAGATESGRPYFVMELVRGIKITEYCDQHALTTEERLKLFVQVCQAIQHAHQKGIIHRDIKPSNILVTTTLEGAMLPVVIDFGIAKATTNQPLTDKTLFTAFELLIGTPAYMSPEQAELTRVDVDTRTDIYSLGVLLYELLTGSTPFDTGSLLKVGLDEIRRVIREQEPARPSTRLSKLTREAITTVALHRHAEAPTLIRAVRGDLDWIAMKALAKDRAQRYATANGLAMDVQRYLAGEPIVARPPSTIYRVQKLMRLNKLAFAAGTAIAAMLVLGLAASLWQAARANREARRAVAAEQQARDDVLKLRNEALDALRLTVAANPADTDKAKQLATIYLWLGQTNEHLAICRKLLDLADNSTDPRSHDRAAKACLIDAHPEPEMLRRAVASGRQALKLAATNDSNRPWFLVTAGIAELRDGRPAEAESLLDEALKLAGDDPNLPGLALAYRTLARAHLGRTEEARADLAELEKLLPALPVPSVVSAILLPSDLLAVCLAHQEAKALLNAPPPLSKP